ncbi:RNA polymerase sigma factor [Gryllotalpicola protaetiae]|uniref:RNA polymerase sigma factor n=1 Tax=Gryllotalpicola protaetiae TaxID=2419771 RepID=UPI001FECA65D|nr:RNA polymerase sigma factor [Gryllotalpicola protaetiae]
MSTDGEIITASRSQPARFGELYDRHARTVHRYAARRAGVQVADDVMAETFLVAFEKRGAFDTDQVDARPWLLGIATTLLRKHARLEAKAWRALVAADAATILAADPMAALGDTLDAAAAVRRIAGAVRRLRDGDRDALLLYAWGDLDYEGVAGALGIPIGTVRSRLNRARTKLRAAFDAGDARHEEVDRGRVDAVAPGAR